MAVDTVDSNNLVSGDFQGPVSGYQLVEAKPIASDQRFVASELDTPEDANPAAGKAASTAVKTPASKRIAQHAVSAVHAVRSDAEKLERSSTKMYVALAAGLGVLTSLAVVAFVLMPGRPVDTSYDMGTVTSVSNGLKGHLVTNWGNRLGYKLTLEPSDLAQLDAFVTAINNPPRPLSVKLQLKDVTGKVLCDTPILLKYDPLRNLPNTASPDAATSGASSKKVKIDESAQTQAEADRALNNARSLGQELSREHGKDIFQPMTGQDGQISSIASQGTLPCTKRQYQSAASWTFVTNFPSLLQTAGPYGSEANDLDDAFGGPSSNSGNSSSIARRKAARKVPLPNSHFSVEQDDVLVGYQSATGIVETRAGKSFLVEKRDQVASSLKGVDFPIPIHYRCDQLGACALAGLHFGIQRAWLEQ
jgi:uncharacterized RmlC-like cupin family protein